MILLRIQSTSAKQLIHMITLNKFTSGLLPSSILCSRKFESNLCTMPNEAPNILQPINKTASSSSTTLRVKNISKAMKAYLERAKNHETFIASKSEEYEIGKQHLANMMGLDVNTMTQHDIDRAIVYLLPSGLYEPKARPLMKPPEKLYPKEKVAQFDDSGRPFNSFFYTNRANFYNFLHSTVEKFHELDALEDKMIRKGINEVPKDTLLNLSGSDWITIDQVRETFVESIKDEEYNFLITTLTRLANHPYSFRCKDHIWKFRMDFADVSKEIAPELMYDDENRPFVEHDGRKRTSLSSVRVYGNGTGKIQINGKAIDYFKNWDDREQIMYPLEYSGLLGKVDVVATTHIGGSASQANAIRYGIAMCLRSFVSEEVQEKLRLGGLLTIDKRYRERKKPGQKGARAKYKWRKR